MLPGVDPQDPQAPASEPQPVGRTLAAQAFLRRRQATATHPAVVPQTAPELLEAPLPDRSAVRDRIGALLRRANQNRQTQQPRETPQARANRLELERLQRQMQGLRTEINNRQQTISRLQTQLQSARRRTPQPTPPSPPPPVQPAPSGIRGPLIEPQLPQIPQQRAQAMAPRVNAAPAASPAQWQHQPSKARQILNGALGLLEFLLEEGTYFISTGMMVAFSCFFLEVIFRSFIIELLAKATLTIVLGYFPVAAPVMAVLIMLTMGLHFISDTFGPHAEHRLTPEYRDFAFLSNVVNTIAVLTTWILPIAGFFLARHMGTAFGMAAGVAALGSSICGYYWLYIETARDFDNSPMTPDHDDFPHQNRILSTLRALNKRAIRREQEKRLEIEPLQEHQTQEKKLEESEQNKELNRIQYLFGMLSLLRKISYVAVPVTATAVGAISGIGLIGLGATLAGSALATVGYWRYVDPISSSLTSLYARAAVPYDRRISQINEPAPQTEEEYTVQLNRRLQEAQRAYAEAQAVLDPVEEPRVLPILNQQQGAELRESMREEIAAQSGPNAADELIQQNSPSPAA